MPNANIIELETCLADCLQVFEQYPTSDYAELYHEPVRKVIKRWDESIRLSDMHHLRWRKEQREERVAYKHLAIALREAHRDLRRIGAIDFPRSNVMYWDQEMLIEAVDQMRGYLRDQGSDIEFASTYLDRFDRLQGNASGEAREADSTLKDFQRFVDTRRESLHEVTSLINDMRVGMRRILGKRSDIYQGIRWPYAIASDDNILF